MLDSITYNNRSTGSKGEMNFMNVVRGLSPKVNTIITSATSQRKVQLKQGVVNKQRLLEIGRQNIHLLEKVYRYAEILEIHLNLSDP